MLGWKDAVYSVGLSISGTMPGASASVSGGLYLRPKDNADSALYQTAVLRFFSPPTGDPINTIEKSLALVYLSMNTKEVGLWGDVSGSTIFSGAGGPGMNWSKFSSVDSTSTNMQMAIFRSMEDISGPGGYEEIGGSASYNIYGPLGVGASLDVVFPSGTIANLCQGKFDQISVSGIIIGAGGSLGANFEFHNRIGVLGAAPIYRQE